MGSGPHIIDIQLELGSVVLATSGLAAGGEPPAESFYLQPVTARAVASIPAMTSVLIFSAIVLSVVDRSRRTSNAPLRPEAPQHPFFERGMRATLTKVGVTEGIVQTSLALIQPFG